MSLEMSADNLESDEWLTRPKRCRVDSSNHDITNSADTLESEFECDGSSTMSNADAESTSSEAFFPSDSDSDSGIPSGGSQSHLSIIFSPISKLYDISAISEDPDKELDEVAQTLVTKCVCTQNCLFNLSANIILRARRKFQSLSTNEQRQWLTDKIHECSKQIDNQTLKTKFVVAGYEVCQFAWCKIHGISERRIARVKKSVSLGQSTIYHGNMGVKRPSERADIAKAWMMRYFNLVGDKMPHNKQIHLPSWDTQKDVYQRFKDDMELQSVGSVVALSTFYRIRTQEFPNVVIPEVCTLCTICKHLACCLQQL